MSEEPTEDLLRRVRDYDQHCSDDDVDRLCDEFGIDDVDWVWDQINSSF